MRFNCLRRSENRFVRISSCHEGCHGLVRSADQLERLIGTSSCFRSWSSTRSKLIFVILVAFFACERYKFRVVDRLCLILASSANFFLHNSNIFHPFPQDFLRDWRWLLFRLFCLFLHLFVIVHLLSHSDHSSLEIIKTNNHQYYWHWWYFLRHINFPYHSAT